MVLALEGVSSRAIVLKRRARFAGCCIVLSVWEVSSEVDRRCGVVGGQAASTQPPRSARPHHP